MKLLDRINDPCDLKKLTLKELKLLAEEIRELLIDISTQRPIHLSSNLGVVEIAMGSLVSFDLPKDKVFYDTGHQSYPHKILTGRKNDIKEIRQGNHISGFQSMDESKYDVFSTGHSGNALSAAQGMELASRSLPKSYIVPIVGDGAIANGESFEALNNIQSSKSRIIIVLNDNGMSISKTVGALARVMAKIKVGKFFFGSEKAAKRIFAGKKATSKPFEILYKSYNWLEQKIVGKNLFQSLGYQYVGPVNGNDLKKVLLAFDKAKWYSENGPVIIHFKTKKGLGLKAAEHDEVGTYHMADKNSVESFGASAAKYLNDIVKSDNKIHVINAAMTLGTGFESFAQTNKENYHDVGIAEEHAVSLASGMVLGGLKPIVNLYSTFMQRSYDQIQHDLARLHLPVLFLVDRADLSPGDGSTHHGIYDVSFLKTVPNVTITAPRDLKQLTDLIELGLSNKTDPFFIRYPKLPLLNPLYKQSVAVQIGTWEKMIDNSNAETCIISYGPYCNDIALALCERSDVDLINAVFITGYNIDNLKQLCERYRKIIVYERIAGNNGLAQDIIIYCQQHHHNVEIITMSYVGFPGHGTQEQVDDEQQMSIKKLLTHI